MSIWDKNNGLICKISEKNLNLNERYSVIYGGSSFFASCCLVCGFLSKVKRTPTERDKGTLEPGLRRKLSIRSLNLNFCRITLNEGLLMEMGRILFGLWSYAYAYARGSGSTNSSPLST